MKNTLTRTLILDTLNHVGEEVLLQGWVHTRRNMGKLIFIDLRDRSGICQVVFLPHHAEALAEADKLGAEYVVEIRGQVNQRPEKQVNAELTTGTVEIEALELTILNAAATPPFEIEDQFKQEVNEELRLKYRYLDLRRERMQRNIRYRDQIISFFRDYMHNHGFVEVETPIMMKGTPEGSREFVIPSRVFPGDFYVLPQSPQQFKQLLMVAGFERYFQIARCFRDEDARKDRQLEFTQLDYEMSFVSQEDVLQFTEAMFIELVEQVAPDKHISTTPFPRLTYAEAMEQYGTDKPDLRSNKNDPKELAFCWILDFPMFEKLEDGTVQAMHHPFCSVQPEDMEKLDSDPMSVRANAYDLVLNGFELSSGSIRIHQAELQQKIFAILGITPEDQQKKFGHMLEAFTFGAPPHGGFAPGIDRIVMILAEEEGIRDVIAFPKTNEGRDLLMNAPASIEPAQLDELHIQITKSS